jgi:hypothetical protein
MIQTDRNQYIVTPLDIMTLESTLAVARPAFSFYGNCQWTVSGQNVGRIALELGVNEGDSGGSNRKAC